MFKKIASKFKAVLFSVEKIDPNSPAAKAQAKMLDELVNQAEDVAVIAKVAASNIAKNAKKEATKAVSDAKKKTAPKAPAAKAKPKKTTK